MHREAVTPPQPMGFHRRLAVAIVVVTAGIYGLNHMPVDLFSPLGIVAGLLGLIAVLGLFVGAGVALFTSPAQNGGRTRQLERFLPAIVLVISLGVLGMLLERDSRNAALAFASEHQSELTGPAPQSIIYSEGVPDGGTVIVSSPARNPMSLSARQRAEMTNGNMTSCKPLNAQLWLCRFG